MNQAIITKKKQVCGPVIEVQAGTYRAHISWALNYTRIENHREALKIALQYKDKGVLPSQNWGELNEWIAGDIDGDTIAWVRMPKDYAELVKRLPTRSYNANGGNTNDGN